MLKKKIGCALLLLRIERGRDESQPGGRSNNLAHGDVNIPASTYTYLHTKALASCVSSLFVYTGYNLLAKPKLFSSSILAF